MDFAHAVDASRIKQDTFCSRRFTGINMSDDANITNLIQRIASHDIQSKTNLAKAQEVK
jgi:hypothetical protein